MRIGVIIFFTEESFLEVSDCGLFGDEDFITLAIRIFLDEYVYLRKRFFMTTKLTLSIKKDTVEKGKRISKQRNKSISKLVEEFIESLPEKETKKKLSIRELSAMMSKNISLPKNLDYKEFIREERYKDMLKKLPASRKLAK